MKVDIVRRTPGASFSMDVYADNLVAGLKAIRPEWEIVEVHPKPWNSVDKLWQSGTGIRKYYERFWHHPQEVSRLKADLYHIIDHTNAHVAYWLKKLGKPIVVTCHDLVHFKYPEIIREQCRFPLISKAIWNYSVRGMKNASQIITVSSNTAKDTNQMLDIDLNNITVIPNGVDSDFHQIPIEQCQSLREKYKINKSTICLLNVGSTHNRKNIISVLKVLKILRDRKISTLLWRVGGAFTTEQEQFIKEHDLRKHIIDFGKLDKYTLVEIYNATDILIAPSIYEGFGLTIIEAMACGTPVITSNVSSLPEVAGDAAILVEPMDVERMVQAVCSLQEKPTYLQSLVDKGLERAKIFSWENTAKQVVKKYKQLAS